MATQGLIHTPLQGGSVNYVDGCLLLGRLWWTSLSLELGIVFCEAELRFLLLFLEKKEYDTTKVEVLV